MKPTPADPHRNRVLADFMRAYRKRKMITRGELACALRATPAQVAELEAGTDRLEPALAGFRFLKVTSAVEQQRFVAQILRLYPESTGQSHMPHLAARSTQVGRGRRAGKSAAAAGA